MKKMIIIILLLFLTVSASAEVTSTKTVDDDGTVIISIKGQPAKKPERKAETKPADPRPLTPVWKAELDEICATNKHIEEVSDSDISFMIEKVDIIKTTVETTSLDSNSKYFILQMIQSCRNLFKIEERRRESNRRYNTTIQTLKNKLR